MRYFPASDHRGIYPSQSNHKGTWTLIRNYAHDATKRSFLIPLICCGVGPGCASSCSRAGSVVQLLVGLGLTDLGALGKMRGREHCTMRTWVTWVTYGRLEILT